MLMFALLNLSTNSSLPKLQDRLLSYDRGLVSDRDHELPFYLMPTSNFNVRSATNV